MSKKGTITVFIVVIVLATAGVFYGIHRSKAADSGTSAKKAADTEDQDSDIIVYNGQKYKYDTDKTAVLFLGVDKTAKADVDSVPGYGGQSDTIILMVMDKKEKTVSLLEISRDTMTDIKVYSESGDLVGTERAQITLQYAYGDSTKRSCHLTKDVVSNLLYGTPIRKHISLNMEGIAGIVDALNGVKITIPEDYTMIDPSFVKGAEVTLNGAQAERYVRYRDTAVTGSNNSRMERQNSFLTAMIRQVKGLIQGGVDGYQLLMDSAGDYVNTDLTADEIKKLSDYSYTEEIIQVPGEVIEGVDHDEFVVNEEKLYEIILELFYKSVK